ncbi:MAG: hypothetical protein LBU00_04700 [Treponema sp.]|jgi:WD40 repeat protein|nr:hypothetical protein [Treponema sp.]
MKRFNVVVFMFCAALSLAAQSPELFLQMGHSNAINAVAYSPDGRRIATGSSDNIIKIWDAESGQELRTLTGHSSYVYALDYSPDGRRIVSGSGDNTVKIWNAETGQELRTLTGYSLAVYALDYSPDGRRIVSGSYDKTVKIWDAESGREIRTFSGHTGWVNSVSFSPDGRRIVSASNDKTIKVWDAETGQVIRTITGHSSWVNSISFSPDGRRIVSTSRDKTIKLWNAESGAELRTITADNSVYSARFSPDGRRIVSGSGDSTAKVWDAETGRETLSLGPTTIPVYRLAFSPDSTRLAVSSLDGNIRIWDTRNGRLLRTVRPHLYNGTPVLSLSLAYSADGSRILSGGDDATIKLLNAGTGETIRSIPTGAGSVLAVCYSPDGRSILAGLQDKVLKLFDAESGRELRSFTGHTDMVTAAIFSADGRRIYSGSDDRSIKVWNAATGQLIRTLHESAHGGRVNTLALWRESGKEYLISGGANGRLLYWDPEKTGNDAVYRTRDYNSTMLSVTTGSGSGDIFIGLADGRIETTGRGELPAFEWAVSQLAFSPDGLWLAAACYDGTVRFLDTTDYSPWFTFIGFTGTEWLTLLPQNYYYGSATADRYLNARVGNNVSSADRYRSNLRPAALALGMTAYKESILRFLEPNNRTALNHLEAKPQSIVDGSTGTGIVTRVTRAEVEAYYRQSMSALIAEVVDEQFKDTLLSPREIQAIKDILTIFFLRPNTGTFNAVRGVTFIYLATSIALSGEKKEAYEDVSKAYDNTLRSLNSELLASVNLDVFGTGGFNFKSGTDNVVDLASKVQQ